MSTSEAESSQTEAPRPRHRPRSSRSCSSFKRPTSHSIASPTAAVSLPSVSPSPSSARRLAELAARVAEAQEQRDKLASQQLTLDQRSEAVGARIATIEQRLRSGRAGSYRDEQAMGEEVASLAHQRREIEDQELEVMEALEPLDQELAALDGATPRRRGAGSGPRAARHGRGRDRRGGSCWSAQLGTSWLPRVAPELVASYERLRAKLGGIGAAHLVGGACSGCHLQLPAGELHRLRHVDARLGRLLRPVRSDTRA